MSGAWRDRVADFFAVDDPWERVPGRRAAQQDLVSAAVLFVLSVLGLELARSAGMMRSAHPLWQEYAGLALMAAPIAFRRRRPLTSALAASAVFFGIGVTMPDVSMQFSIQVLYFYALFSAMAWGADRRAALVTMGVVLVVMFGWLAYQFVLGSAVDEITAEQRSAAGVFGPVMAAVLYIFLINVLYFGGAVIGGQAAWRAARRRSALADQAAQLRAQAAAIKDHAVVEERLRIARELHDVVAHHVSVMGVQAAAARRVLAVDPPAATAALASVESSARQAVTEMRSLLGTLRQDHPDDGASSRSPEPSLAILPELLHRLRDDGLDVTYSVVAPRDHAVAELPPAVGLTLYRTVQEALNNVRRHSTATGATVVLRVDDGGASGGYAEVEILDAGRPRTGTSGTGLGLLGMRERVAALHGSLEIGPRAVGGYRVRVRLPIGAGSDTGTGGDSSRPTLETVR